MVRSRCSMNRQSKDFQGFRYHVIERPYFGNFLYKVLFRGPETKKAPAHMAPLVVGLISKADAFEIQKYRRLHGLIRERARELSGEQGFRFRQDSGLNVYLHDQECARCLAREFREQVLGIWGPLDDAHQKHAMSAPRIAVRKSLWRGRFRYRLVLRLDPAQDQGKQLRELLENLDFGCDYDMNRSLEDFVFSAHPGPSFSWQSGEKLLYCNDEGLIMMINLLCTDAVHKIDKVITHDELSQQEKIAAQDAGA